MNTQLYLGTDPSHFKPTGKLIHYPVIKIVPRPFDPEIQASFEDLSKYTHVVFTSKNAVNVFFNYLGNPQLILSKQIIAIGSVTAFQLQTFQITPVVCNDETQEGVIDLLQTMDLKNAYLFLPCSALSRPCLAQYLTEKQIAHCVCVLYDTISQAPEPLPDLTQVNEIIFTSPSTVRAFCVIFPKIPAHIHCVAIGPITQKALDASNLCG